MISALPLAVLTLAAPDIAPNPRNRSAMDLAPNVTSTEVAMRAEVVEVVLHEDYAEVRAVFDMEHTGDSPESLEVGFPTEARPIERSVRESLDDGNGVYSGWGGTIYAFSAKVDGVMVKAERKEVDEDDPREVHRHWVCWPMTFEPGQRSRVEVRYEVETKDDFFLGGRRASSQDRDPQTALQPRELIYVLKTGRGWHDSIGSARILLRAAEGFDLGRVGPVEPAPTTKREAEWEWLIKDFEPDQDIRVRYRVFRDAKHAVARLSADLEKRPDDAIVVLNLAENHAALGSYSKAAELYARLADWGQGEVPRPRYRYPKIVTTRLYYTTAAFLAARHYAAAGELELARDPWALRAAAELDQRIESLTDYIERYALDARFNLEDERVKLKQAQAYRSELSRLL